MTGIIIKNYEHFNRAMGVHVKNKDHYDRLMKEGNYIPYEQSVQNSKNAGNKPYVASKKALAIIEAAKNGADKKGRVKLSSRTIDAMKEIGAIGKKVPEYMKTKELNGKGGFYK